jgi:hypothetical protein
MSLLGRTVGLLAAIALCGVSCVAEPDTEDVEYTGDGSEPAAGGLLGCGLSTMVWVTDENEICAPGIQIGEAILMVFACHDWCVSQGPGCIGKVLHDPEPACGSGSTLGAAPGAPCVGPRYLCVWEDDPLNKVWGGACTCSAPSVDPR